MDMSPRGRHFFGPNDAGECPVPLHRLPDCESWVSAAPLLGLNDDQFLRLQVPKVTNTQHLWALKHQLIKAEDRKAILQCQGPLWADDEIRHHVALLLKMRDARQFAQPLQPNHKCRSLGPLLLTGWAHHGTLLCHEWAQSHLEIHTDGCIVISAYMLNGHWVPVVMTPQHDVLQWSMWDAPSSDHTNLNKVIEVSGTALGFKQVTCLRHQRIFFTSDKCGALAMAFLHHVMFDSMLPTSAAEGELVHNRLKEVFAQTVASCSLAHRHWIWGTGDQDGEIFTNEPCRSSHDPPAQNQPLNATVSFSHQCMEQEIRMDLLREKGKWWGDDEICFHINHLLTHPQCVVNAQFATIPGFVTMDPLMLPAWDTIGKPLCDAWCRRHMVVPEKGFMWLLSYQFGWCHMAALWSCPRLMMVSWICQFLGRWWRC